MGQQRMYAQRLEHNILYPSVKPSLGFKLVSGWVIVSLLLRSIFPHLPLNYAIYVTPVVSILVNFQSSEPQSYTIRKRYLGALTLYVLAAVMSLASVGRNGDTFLLVRDFCIIAGAFITFLPRLSPSESDIRLLFAGICLAGLTGSFLDAGSFSFTFDFISSKGIAETSYAFTVAAFAIYFLMIRTKAWTLLAILFMAVFFKRMAILGFFIVASLHYLSLLLLNNKEFIAEFLRKITFVVWLVTFLSGVFMVFLVSSLFNFLGIFDVSPEVYLLGRMYLSSTIYQDLLQSSFIELFFGHSPGSSEALVSQTLGFGSVNPHNDHLKILYEYGLVGSALVYLALWKVFSQNRLGIYLFMFNMFSFVTDNMLIYFFHTFVCIVLIERYNMRRSTVEG